MVNYEARIIPINNTFWPIYWLLQVGTLVYIIVVSEKGLNYLLLNCSTFWFIEEIILAYFSGLGAMLCLSDFQERIYAFLQQCEQCQNAQHSLTGNSTRVRKSPHFKTRTKPELWEWSLSLGKVTLNLVSAGDFQLSLLHRQVWAFYTN